LLLHCLAFLVHTREQKLNRVRDFFNLGRTPIENPTTNPMQMATTQILSSAISVNENNARRFDAIMGQFKQSIRRKRQHLNSFKRNELSDLIAKLQQELFSETSQVLSDGDRSDDENDMSKSNARVVEDLLHRSLDQNQILLRLVDRLTTHQLAERNGNYQLDINGIVKVIIAIMLLWTLNILCQKE
jgi:hypothetical protein